MIRGASLFRSAVAVLVTAAAVALPARAQSPRGPLSLLDVPYLPQSVALCGGAAAAMVMRYWGATGVYAETFSGLVIAAEEGIRGEDLIGALTARGWDARSFRGDAALVQAQLAQRRPVIALIEDRPGSFHYVVVVGWAAGRVIAHDPARAPYRVLDEAAFDTAWKASGYWTMLALPPAGGVGAPLPASAAETAPRPSPCDGLVDEGVRLAGAGDLAAARRALEAAGESCPQSSAPARELAGLHALRDEWPAAAAQARRAVHLDPQDRHAWRILATALYIEGDAVGALRAWNELGEPLIEVLDIKGLGRTRYAVASGAMRLDPQSVLTAPRLAQARRRLAELPSAQVTRVTFRPREAGRANVDAVVVERPLLPTGRVDLLAAGVRALSDRELRATIASPTGGGESLTLAWRWWENRPRALLDARAPSPFGGVWGVELSAARETFATPSGVETDRWRRAMFSIGDWTARGLRWNASVGAERWPASRSAAVLGLDIRQLAQDDRFVADGHAAMRAGMRRAWTLGARAEWRTSPRHEGSLFIVHTGIDAAGPDAPRPLWPSAGTGQGREVLLRAHPLLDDGVVTGIFGRTLAHGGVEWRRWRQWRGKPLRWAPAVFADTARALRGDPGYDGRWHVDAGVGVRGAIPGAGVVRLDLARGLRDGGLALSLGWTR